MESRPPLHFGVVAIEKGTFGSPSTKVTNFTFFFIHADETTGFTAEREKKEKMKKKEGGRR